LKFKHGNRRKPIEYEKDLVKVWKKNKTFEKSLEKNPASDPYVFYDGPPFITGVPHHGTLLTSVVKDAVPRFWTMNGKRVERSWGWDCHGLPAEYYTESKLGIKDKRDIGTKISLEDYIIACKENMVLTGSEWEDTIDRIGRWVDFKTAYKTMDKEYMESVWWAFKELYDKGKIYEGEKVLMYCTRDATPLAKAEIAMDDSYKDVTDPSVYVKFKLVGENKYMLAWTTTPWTLPSNSSVAVNKDLTYAEVELDGEVYIVAESLLEKALTDEKNKTLPYKVLDTYKGDKLVGKHYEPLFDPEGILKTDKLAFKVWHAPFVHEDEGTGIAHESPAYGEEDYELSKEHGFPWIMSTDENGIFTMGEWKDKSVWDVNKEIAKTLKERGKIWKIEYITHSYPHCHRCGTPLMYRAHPSWFMDIDGQREEMLEYNSKIGWFPEHIRHGRSEKTMQSAPDWNLSRDRFWATPMPIWQGETTKGETVTKIIGSYAELEEFSGKTLEDYHRPWIDDVTFKIDGVEYRRIEKVMDSWFESGSMPFAQFHYPFENNKKFEDNYPADFIVEYVGQVRAWFYYMHVVSVGLFGRNAFKNAIVHGTLAGNDGRKMSKSYGNYTDPNELMDLYSSDGLRFLFLSASIMNGEDFVLVDSDVADVHRKLQMIWNMYDFFTMYAEVDKWEWDGKREDPTDSLSNRLDLWIVSRVHQLSKEVSDNMKKYDLPSAMKPVLPFIDDASNWYVRRSRKRFWKATDDKDKDDAYRTLHYVLLQLAHILAPATPFLSEELYVNLTGGESVHLEDWPEEGHVNELLVQEMAQAREIVKAGLSQRAMNQMKVRQPLASAKISDKVKLDEDTVSMVMDELNVKEVTVDSSVDVIELDLKLTKALKEEGLARELVRFVQSARKNAGLDVDNRINLSLVTDDGVLSSAIKSHSGYIMQETLAKVLDSKKYSHTEEFKAGGRPVVVSLEKA